MPVNRPKPGRLEQTEAAIKELAQMLWDLEKRVKAAPPPPEAAEDFIGLEEEVYAAIERNSALLGMSDGD